MSYTVEKISSNKVKMSFTIPAAEFDAAMDKAYLKNRGRIAIPGFRKGKAPRKVIENYYGEGVFYDDAFDAVFPDAYRAAVEAENLEVVDQPELDVKEIGAGKDLVIDLEVFVKPDVTLGEYKNLTVEIEKETVTEADVTARIEQDRAKVSATEEVLDRPVEIMDVVNLDYAGTVDGVAFEGGTAQGQTLTIGSHQFIPGFEEQMIGMCVAEEKDLNVTFPEQYGSAELAGKDAVFHVKVNSISKTVLPELDDDFAADVSDFSTFAEYKADIEKQLNERAEKNNRVAAENALVEKAADNATVDIPQAMIADETESMVRDMEIRMAYQGMRMEDFLKYTKQTRADVAKMYEDQAAKRVKMQLVIEAIRKAENVEADEEDVAAQMARQAEAAGVEVEEYESKLTEQQKGYVAANAAVQKVVDMLFDTAVITEKKPEEKAEEKTEE